MDYGEFINLISSLGFPIVCCFALWKSNEKNNELHRKEVDELRKAIENNTQVMIQISERLLHE